MKRLTILLAVCVMPFFALSQINNFELPLCINTTGNDRDFRAMPDLQSTNKGALIPCMTAAQGNVLETGTESFWFYKVNAWTGSRGFVVRIQVWEQGW